MADTEVAILVVARDVAVLDSLRRALHGLGLRVVTADSVAPFFKGGAVAFHALICEQELLNQHLWGENLVKQTLVHAPSGIILIAGKNGRAPLDAKGIVIKKPIDPIQARYVLLSMLSEMRVVSRRNHPRYATDVGVELEIEGYGKVQGQVLNIGVGGMFVHIDGDSDLPGETTCRYLVANSGGSGPLQGIGRIRWTKALPESGIDLGIQFVTAPTHKLQAFLATLSYDAEEV